MHEAWRHVVHGGNGCEWVDVGYKLVRIGGSGLKMSRSEWEWMRVGQSGWEWMGVDENAV